MKLILGLFLRIVDIFLMLKEKHEFFFQPINCL